MIITICIYLFEFRNTYVYSLFCLYAFDFRKKQNKLIQLAGLCIKEEEKRKEHKKKLLHKYKIEKERK